MDATVKAAKTVNWRNQTWRRRFLGLFWFVHPSVVLIVGASPAQCLHTLMVASRPSTQRLHHRNLFASGRRYELVPREGGFRMRTTSKVSWHYRYRTQSAAVLSARFFEMGSGITRLQLEIHIGLRELVNFLFIPTFMTSIIAFVPWNFALILGLISVLYTLSWIAHRSNAALEANEMVFFIQQALEDLAPVEIKTLHASSPDLVYDQFDDEWEKFYRRQNSKHS